MKHTDAEFTPLHTVRDGNLCASIFVVMRPTGPAYRVRVASVYRADAEFKYSNLFSSDELLRLSKLTTDAYSWIANHRLDEGDLFIRAFLSQ